MFENHEASSKNWNYPLAAATLIYKLFTEPLYKPIYQKFLIETLVGCQTGKERLAEPFCRLMLLSVINRDRFYVFKTVCLKELMMSVL